MMNCSEEQGHFSLFFHFKLGKYKKNCYNSMKKGRYEYEVYNR